MFYVINDIVNFLARTVKDICFVYKKLEDIIKDVKSNTKIYTVFIDETYVS